MINYEWEWLLLLSHLFAKHIESTKSWVDYSHFDVVTFNGYLGILQQKAMVKKHLFINYKN
jgi:hypothetical protein